MDMPNVIKIGWEMTELVYDPKGHGDLSGNFNIVYDPKR